MEKAFIPAVVIAVLAFFLLTQSLFIVDQREQAIVLQLGQPKGEPRGPGLHVKIPIVQDVVYFDHRILSVDPGPEQMVISSSTTRTRRAPLQSAPQAQDNEEADAPPPIENVSGEPIIVDTFARYRIVDPLQFMKTLRTTHNANARLSDILKESTKAVLGNTTLQDLLSEKRTAVMTNIQNRINAAVQDQLGIEIVDVRIIRADLTSDLRTSTVRRMISELKERATETRALGEERALEIRSTAEKERAVIIAEAQRDAEVLKGKGDQEAIQIYAKAFNKDKDFYAFTRSMEAYRRSLANPDTRLVISPDSSFFRYFKNHGAR